MKETGLTGKRRSTTIAATPHDGKSQRKRRRRSVVTSLQNSANVPSALMLFNVMMVIAAMDRPSAAESDLLCRHAHSSCRYAGADCGPTPSQI